MPLQNPPLRMAFRYKNALLIHNAHFKKSPYHRGRGTTPSHTSPAWSLCSFTLPPLTNTGYTTVTGVAKGVQGPSPPPPHCSESLYNKSFNVQKKAIWIHIIKKSPYHGVGDTPPPPPPHTHTPSPRSVALAPR